MGHRMGHAEEVIKERKYLDAHPASYYGDVETPEFKAIVNPLDRTIRALAEADGKTEAEVDEEADKYMNIVFELCTAYERQSYIEGLKVGVRLMVELMEV